MAQSREQARIAERRRQERRAARQELARQQRRARSVIASVVAVVLVIGVAIGLAAVNRKSPATGAAGSKTTPTDTATAAPTTVATTTPPVTATAAADPLAVACGAKAPAAPKTQTFAAEPPLSITATAHYVAAIATSCGTLTVDMDAAKTPRTVNSWYFLASKKFFDGTPCHRMTSGTLSVLQCGDPTGTGTGGPGYQYPDENLAGATYPKGTVAMANSGPQTNGSQFFIVYADSQLGPNYTVVGHVSTDTAAVLDKIAAVGIAGGAQDGAPAKKIFLDSLTVTKKA